MIHLIENLPGNVVGLKAEGKVTREDYELRIMPQIRAREREFDKIRLIYVLGGDFMGYTVGAFWKDPTLAFRRPGSWERIAIVSDSDALRMVMALLSWVIPSKMKVYRLASTDEAKSWVAAA